MSSEASQHSKNVSNPFVNFELEKVLSQSDRNKFMALLGRYECRCNGMHHSGPASSVICLTGGAINPIRGSYCFRDDHSILPMSKICWPPAQAPSWIFIMMFTPRHAESFSDMRRSVSLSFGSMLCHLQYSSTITPKQGTITVDTIYPATEKHISKHTTQNFVMVSLHTKQRRVHLPASAYERSFHATAVHGTADSSA